MMLFHKWLGQHHPDHQRSRWDNGYFVSRCTLCGAAMIKLPGLPWRLRASAA